MDPVIHMLIGVGIANAFVRRRIGFPAVRPLGLVSVMRPHIGMLFRICLVAAALYVFRSVVVERPPLFVFRFLVGGHGILRRWDGEGRP